MGYLGQQMTSWLKTDIFLCGHDVQSTVDITAMEKGLLYIMVSYKVPI